MATWVPTTPELGLQPITTTSTTQLHPIGKVIQAYDNTTSGYGNAEFMYLNGVASTVVGSLVTYNQVTGVTALCPSTANLAQPLAVAMSANVAAQWGWYQIGGVATIKKTAVKINPNVALFISATTGRVFPTATTGKAVLGARSANATTIASATSTIDAIIDRPHAQGQII